MKVLVIGNRDRFEKYMPDLPVVKDAEIVYCKRGSTDAELLAAASDAEVILADPMGCISGEVIRNMPNLKLIHSEGVGFNNFDGEAAAEKGVYLCNCKGVNAKAVAEQTILLMLGLLRNVTGGDRDERAGLQIQTKERMMVEGIVELSECKVGLVGMGDIARETLKRLRAFECPVCYWNRTRKPELEQEYGMVYLPLEELLEECDIVSLHLAVTPETTGIADERFLSRMKRTAYLINTSRGNLVDNEALRDAIVQGKIAGAGLDTVDPEPTTADNILLHLPHPYEERILFSPHIGGITRGTFLRAHRLIWENAERVSRGERPLYVVNGVQ